MQKQLTIKITPKAASQQESLKESISKELSIPSSQITGYYIIKKSLDARSKQVWMMLTLNVFINEPFEDRPVETLQLKEVSKSTHKVIIVGAGPAGLFAALYLIGTLRR